MLSKQIGVGKMGFPTIKATVELPETAAEWEARGIDQETRDDLARQTLVIKMQAAARDALTHKSKDEDAAVVQALADYTYGAKGGPRHTFVEDIGFTDEQVKGLAERKIYVRGRSEPSK